MKALAQGQPVTSLQGSKKVTVFWRPRGVTMVFEQGCALQCQPVSGWVGLVSSPCYLLMCQRGPVTGWAIIVRPSWVGVGTEWVNTCKAFQARLGTSWTHSSVFPVPGGSDGRCWEGKAGGGGGSGAFTRLLTSSFEMTYWWPKAGGCRFKRQRETLRMDVVRHQRRVKDEVSQVRPSGGWEWHNC